VGKLADFVVLAADPVESPPGEIHKIAIEQTYVAGKQRWKR
jgi:predicted amidohydrolase YtcJ